MISIAFEGTTCSSERTYLLARNQDKPSATYYLGVICKMNSAEYARGLAPLGGNAVSYASKYRVHLDYRGGYRRARLDLGPCPPQDDISFAINERGFTDVADD